MKTILTLVLVFLAIITSTNAFSQADLHSLVSPRDEAKLNGDIESMNRLQKEIDNITGNHPKTDHQQDGFSVTLNEAIIGDNNLNTLVTSQDMLAMATCTESIGNNIGRIWIAAAYEGMGADTIAIFRSDDNGVTFTLVNKTVYVNVTIKSDQLDMEIIENTSGDKFLWISRGMLNFTNNNEYTGLTILNTTTNSASTTVLSWPGQGANTKYFNPRICSDNEFYDVGTYTYITAAMDSIAADGSHHYKIKYAQCNNPFTTTPAINYNTRSICGTYIKSHTISFSQDITFYRKGGLDSLAVVFNNRADSTYISLKSFRRDEALAYSQINVINFRQGANCKAIQPRIATSGVTNVMMVFTSNYNNSGDWDLYSFYCNNGLMELNNWQLKGLDGYASIEEAPGRCDLISVKRGQGSFKAAYGINSSVGRLKLSSFNLTAGQWSSGSLILESGVMITSPIAGYRLAGTDSAFVGYIGSGRTNAYTVAGNNGNITGIDPVNNNPDKFELSQNYPNPFNPSTKISFSIPVSGLVTLDVYDISGKLVTSLVNETKNAGKYEIEFNGSDLSSGTYFYRITSGKFTETKKMLLIK